MSTGNEQFGEFEAVRELNKTGLSVIYSARRGPPPADPVFAIKCLQTPAFWPESQTRRGSEIFLAAALLQKRVAEADPVVSKWAPIYGQPTAIPGGAYYVTDLFKASAEDFCTGRRDAVRAAGLWHIIDSVLTALEQLQAVADRPHGRLKPMNVLVMGLGTAKPRVAVCDPLADDLAARRLGRAGDFRALGDLIYSLVIREAPPADRPQVDASRLEWSALGSHGSAWRELCARLRGDGEALESFDQVRKLLAPLSPEVRTTRLRWVAIAAVFIAVGIGAMFLFERWNCKTRNTPESWQKFCAAWNASPFLTDSGHSQHVRDVLALMEKNDPNLSVIVQKIRDAEKSVQEVGQNPKSVRGDLVQYASPRQIVEDPGYSSTLSMNLPAAAKTCNAGRITFKTNQLLTDTSDALEAKKKKLEEELETWKNKPEAKLRQSMAEVRTGLEKIGDPGKAKPDELLTAIETLLKLADAKESLERINSHLDALDRIQAKYNDPFIKKVRDSLAEVDKYSFTRAGWVDLVNRQDAPATMILTTLKISVDKSFDAAQPQFDHARLCEEVSKRLEGGLPETTEKVVPEDVVADWCKQADSYRILSGKENPLDSSNLPWVKLTKAKAEFPAELAKTASADAIKSFNEIQKGIYRTLTGEFKEFQEEIGNLSSKIPVSQDASELRGRIVTLSATLEKMNGELRDLEADKKKLLKELSAETSASKWAKFEPASNALDELLKSRAAVLLEDKQLEGLPLKREMNFLKETLSKLNEALPLESPDSTPNLAPWVVAMNAATRNLREMRMKDLAYAVNAEWGKLGVDRQGPIERLRGSAQDSWKDQRQKRKDWIAHGINLEKWMSSEQMYALNEPISETGPTFVVSMKKWVDDFKELEVPAPGKAVDDQLALVKAWIVAGEILDKNLEAFRDEKQPPGIRRTALIASADLPKETRPSLKKEKIYLDDLKTLVGGIKDGERKSKLLEKEAALRKERWRVRLTDPLTVRDKKREDERPYTIPAGFEDIDDAKGHEADFGITEADLGDPKIQFNLKLYALVLAVRQSSQPDAKVDKVARDKSDKEAREAANTFIASIGGLKTDPDGLKAIGALIGKGDSELPDTYDSTHDSGPQPPIWKLLKSSPNAPDPIQSKLLVFERDLKESKDISRPKKLRLEFLPVVVTEGSNPTYVARTTVSLALFEAEAEDLMIANWRKNSDALNNNLSGWTVSNDQRTIEVRTAWLKNSDTESAAAGPAAGANDTGIAIARALQANFNKYFKEADDRPSWHHPMHYVPVNFAEAFAKKLQCRLITVDEWTAARKMEADIAGKKSWNPKWNLKDKTFADYNAKVVSTAGERFNGNSTTFNPVNWNSLDRSRKYAEIWAADLTHVVPLEFKDSDKPLDDGAMFFLPVDPTDSYTARSLAYEGQFGTLFYHLIGNVWQYATDAGGKKVVIGGSALSGPKMDDKAGPNYANPRPVAADGMGYVDVGIRLAFKSKPPTFRDALAQALGETSFHTSGTH